MRSDPSSRDASAPLAGRRPLASRNTAWARAVAAWLARRGISPNTISLAALGFGIGASCAFAFAHWCPAGVGRRILWLLGAGAVQLRLLGNLLDGMVAIEGGRATPTGELHNEVPDRVADAATLVGAGIASAESLALGLPLGLVAALVALFVAYSRAIGRSLTGASLFLGPMAKQHRMALVTLTALALAFLPTSWHEIATITGAPNLMAIALAMIVVGGIVTAVRRLRRIADLLREGGAR